MSKRPTASLVTYTCPMCNGVVWGLDRPPAELKHSVEKHLFCQYDNQIMIRSVSPLTLKDFTELQALLTRFESASAK